MFVCHCIILQLFLLEESSSLHYWYYISKSHAKYTVSGSTYIITAVVYRWETTSIIPYVCVCFVCWKYRGGSVRRQMLELLWKEKGREKERRFSSASGDSGIFSPRSQWFFAGLISRTYILRIYEKRTERGVFFVCFLQDMHALFTFLVYSCIIGARTSGSWRCEGRTIGHMDTAVGSKQYVDTPGFFFLLTYV